MCFINVIFLHLCLIAMGEKIGLSLITAGNQELQLRDLNEKLADFLHATSGVFICRMYEAITCMHFFNLLLFLFVAIMLNELG